MLSEDLLTVWVGGSQRSVKFQKKVPHRRMLGQTQRWAMNSFQGLRIAQDNLTLDLQHSSFLQIGQPCILQGKCGSCPPGNSVHTTVPTGGSQSPSNFFKIKRNYNNESESVSYRPKYDYGLLIWLSSEDHTIKQSPGRGLKSPPQPVTQKMWVWQSRLEMPSCRGRSTLVSEVDHFHHE